MTAEPLRTGDVDDRARAEELLRELAGPDAILRPDQGDAIDALVHDRRRVLLVQRTGWGKSAVYFIATRMLRDAGAGPTLLVSPLLALMRDQITAARGMGVVAETINSTNVDDWRAIEERITRDEIDLICISPERLNNATFVERVLPDLAARVGLVVIDEAHCISAWGHDFRPDYQRVRDALARLQPGVPVLATTATATSLVVDDVRTQLGVEPLTLRGTLERDSLALSILSLPTAAERLAFVAQTVAGLEGSGIVYTLTVDGAEQTAAWLQECGVDAVAYTGRTDPDERVRIETRLSTNDVKVVVATTALGMGYDKPDLAWVVHLGAPSSITAYYQAVGRAGRALDRADAILLPSPEDRVIWSYFESVAFPRRPLAEAVVAALEEADGPLSEAALEARVDIRRTRLSAMLKVLDVEGALRRVTGGWQRTDRPWSYDEERYRRVRAAREADAEQMLAYERHDGCLMRFLRTALDDPHAAAAPDCGRCANCAGTRPDPPAPARVEAARAFLQGVDVPLEPRKMWPSGLEAVKGRIPEERRALPGRALAAAGDGTWSPVVDRAFAAADAAGPGPLDPDALDPGLVDGVVKLLGRWGWPAGRPRFITWVPSRTRGPFLEALARRLGEIGRLPVVDTLERTRDAPPQREQANSAHACANVHGAFAARAGVTIPDGPVLVLDDTTSSGWTMTVVADVLGSAGASPVYPLVLLRE